MRLNTIKPAPGRGARACASAAAPPPARARPAAAASRASARARAATTRSASRAARCRCSAAAEGRLPLGDQGARAPKCACTSWPGSTARSIDLAALEGAPDRAGVRRAGQGRAVGRAQEGRDAEGHRRHQGRARGDRSGGRQGRGLNGQRPHYSNPAAAPRRGRPHRRDPQAACCSCSARWSSIASAPSFRCRASTRRRWRASSTTSRTPSSASSTCSRGGALQRMSIFAMGVMPYISASIIIQMLSMVVPTLMELRKEGESGPAQDHAADALRHRGPGAVPVVRRRGGAAERRHGARPRLAVAAHRHHHDDHRHDVPDVARRADHRARRRQRHLDDHPVRASSRACRARVGRTVRVGQHRRNAAAVRDHPADRDRARRHWLLRVRRARAAAHHRATTPSARSAAACTPGRAATCRSSSTCRASSRRSSPRACCCSRRRSRASSAPAPTPGSRTCCSDVAASLGYGQPLHLVLYAALIIVLLLLLHRAGVQRARDRRQPQEVRRVHSRHPSGPADRRVHRQGADAPDAVGRDVHHGGVPAAGDPGFLAGRAVPVRRHVAADRRGGGDGLHGAAAGAHDVAPVSGSDEEGQSARRAAAAVQMVER